MVRKKTFDCQRLRQLSQIFYDITGKTEFYFDIKSNLDTKAGREIRKLLKLKSKNLVIHFFHRKSMKITIFLKEKNIFYMNFTLKPRYGHIINKILNSLSIEKCKKCWNIKIFNEKCDILMKKENIFEKGIEILHQFRQIIDNFNETTIHLSDKINNPRLRQLLIINGFQDFHVFRSYSKGNCIPSSISMVLFKRNNYWKSIRFTIAMLWNLRGITSKAINIIEDKINGFYANFDINDLILFCETFDLKCINVIDESDQRVTSKFPPKVINLNSNRIIHLLWDWQKSFNCFHVYPVLKKN